ncbi:flavocytochrome c [Alkalihalobacillus sp. BA299]|uniref:FAD-dependent oxidoreductase n=1 Tax=Alkalihalobacillus sp. BA299 TaxID=2815938 RepID=UPI001ADCC9B9|nr:flavocytochrome c [Alkalihalobacillus sp. BA299]
MWDAELDVVIAGAGGCGLIAALAAAEKGLEVAVFEKTEFILGNTAASAGMIPAAGTRFQKEKGIFETAEEMAEDILKKNHYESDSELTLALCQESARLIEWMVDSLGIELSLVEEFSYPGQRNRRMHAPKSRSGLELIKKLRMEVSNRDNIYLTLKSELTDVIIENGKVSGVEVDTSHGKQKIKAEKVILATNGFGANKDLVNKYIPEIADALYFGYEANTGEAIKIGEKIGAALDCLTAYQGHSAVDEAHGILVTWGTIMMGGFMVNKEGQRFGDEAQGYSEFAKEILLQPDKHGYIIFDEDIYDQLLSIEDFKNIAEMNGFKSAETVVELAEKLKIDGEALINTMEEFELATERGKDAFGRKHFPKKLTGKLYGIRVVPALFHTQGGLKINTHAQVLNNNNEVIENLYAGGGAAVGVSGKNSYGYMSGNGLLAALGFGKIAGDHAAKTIQERVENK